MLSVTRAEKRQQQADGEKVKTITPLPEVASEAGNRNNRSANERYICQSANGVWKIPDLSGASTLLLGRCHSRGTNGLMSGTQWPSKLKCLGNAAMA